MTEKQGTNKERKESIFLNERFMAAMCITAAVMSLASMALSARGSEPLEVFENLTKVVTVVFIYLAFKYFKWDVAKGLVGGAFFCLMYQEANLVLGRLWGEQDFDVYLVAGVQGSIYLAASGMALLMTVIITINHFFISYSIRGNPKDVILNRIAVIFKLAVYILLLYANSRLGLSADLLWKNAARFLADIAMLLLLVSVEAQIDTFNALRQELLTKKRARRKDE